MVPEVAGVTRGLVLDGRYRIEEVVGQGGMATVYRAHDEILDRDVAIKLFPSTPDGDEVLRHHSEMHVLARLSHPGLVTLHDAGSAYAGGPNEQTYLVMELVTGPTLSDLLATGPLPSRHVARVGRQLAEALTTVHEAGVVHRDIKPANVLLVEPAVAQEENPDAALTTGPVVKIADFGIARFADGARLTMTGTTLGTATYLSPEQAAGTTVGPATDVYALGLVLLECLTGRRAFTGTVVEVAAARLNTSPAIPTALGQEWCALLSDMTRRSAEERPTMAQVATRLAPLAAEQAGDESVSLGSSAAQGERVLDVPTADHLSTPAAAPESPEEDPVGATRRYRTAQIIATARRRAVRSPGGAGSEEAVPDDVGPDTVEGAAPPPVSGPSTAILLALAVLALLLAAAAFLSRPVSTAPEPGSTQVPQVEGPLGDSLEDLMRSVEP